MEPCYRYRVHQVIDVHDGDTFRCYVDCGFRVMTEIAVRVRGVDTPEMHDKDPGKREAAQEAQRFTEALLRGAPVLILESYKDRESFARWVCDVWVADELLSERIIAAGHGVPLIIK